MTTPNRTQIIAEKVKAFAIGLIGSLLFSLGLTYFSEKTYYQVPRILLPIYEYFGNIGLAVGLVILGGGLLFWAYKKYRHYGGKPIIMWVTLPLFIALSFAVTKLTEKTYQPDFGTTNHQAERERVADEIENAARPKFNNQSGNEYLDKLENLLQEMTKAQEADDQATFDKLEEEYLNLNTAYSEIFQEMHKTDKYREFVMYNASISEKINKLRGR